MKYLPFRKLVHSQFADTKQICIICNIKKQTIKMRMKTENGKNIEKYAIYRRGVGMRNEEAFEDFR